MLPAGFTRAQLPVDVRRFASRFYGRLRTLSWPMLVVLTAVHFTVSYWVLRLLGEQSLRDFHTFWYFYLTTATTVGYGDLSPQTVGGRYATTLLVMPGGILLFTSVLARFAQTLIDQWRQRMRGHGDYSHLQGHIVILGWLGRQSERMYDLLKADRSERRDIVILANLAENPRPDDAYFVATGLLSDPDALARTGVREAALLIACGRDDNTTLSVALAAGALNPQAHLVAYFVDKAPADILKLHCPQAECIVSTSVESTVRAAQDPGASRLIRQLLSSLEGEANVYRMGVPGEVASVRYGALLTHLKHEHDATLVAVQRGGEPLTLNPATDLCVSAGDDLYLIAGERLEPAALDWPSVPSCTLRDADRDADSNAAGDTGTNGGADTHGDDAR